MPITFSTCGQDVEEMCRACIRQYHPKLLQAEVTVGLLFANNRTDEGEEAGPAVKLHGRPCYAIIKINGLKDRVEGKPDATITIAEKDWEGFPAEERMALLDHELTHLVIQEDEEGNIKSDDVGRPKLKMRLHDQEISWFDEVAQRHKQHSFEYKGASEFFKTWYQPLFPSWG